MISENQNICRLCFGSVEDGMGEKIEDIQREMLDVLLIQLDLTVSENPILCGQCLTKIQDFFDFKSNCIDIEDYLTPFKKDGELDLKSVYKKKVGLHNSVNEQELPCRLCIELTNGSEKQLDETDLKKCKLYLPEIDLESTKHVVFCSKCYSSQQNYFSFTESCTKNEQKLCNYCKKVRRRNRTILLHTFSEYLTKESLPLSSVHQLNSKRKKRSKKLDEYKCDICSYKTTNVTYIRQHKRSHTDLPEEELFKCSVCPLQTKYKSSLNKHMQINHSDHRYCCSECSFETKHKISLIRHLAAHRETTLHECESCHFRTKYSSTIERHVCKIKKAKQVLKCPTCTYKTTKSYSLKMHSLLHKSPSEIQMFKCEICDFKAKLKTSVKRHMLIHQKPEQTTYKCPYCQYNTFSTWGLNIHIKTHDASYDIKHMKKEEYLHKLGERSYKCTQCSFASLNTAGLKRHIAMRHGDVKRVYKRKEVVKVKKKKHECSICGYKTYQKFSLRMHMRSHQDTSEVQMHKCDRCSFETKWESCLTNHKNLHKDPSEIVMFQCPLCTFKTMHRGSLRTHKMSHVSTTTVFKCKKCSFRTKWVRCLKSHQIVHAPPELKCTKCSFRTRYPRSLRNHMRDLHNPSDKDETREMSKKKTMQCAICMHEFTCKTNMIRHLRNTHGKGMPIFYKCNKCPYITKWGSSMKAHKIVHEDKENLNLFECELCGYKSKYKRVLKNHISNRHAA